jgi:hypothetical protein
MEYYRGILFLTTNRIGHIDDAIMSRVHLVLKYDRLDNNARRTIWTQFMDKLEEDGATFTVDRRAKKYLLEVSESELTSWNGREIRNGNLLYPRIFLSFYFVLYLLTWGSFPNCSCARRIRRQNGKYRPGDPANEAFGRSHQHVHGI